MKMNRYDVVVAGGGPAGTAAAIAAARNGAKTLLIEQYGFLGGTPVNALVPVFCPFSDKERAIIRGIGLEILEEMKSESWINPEPEENNGITALDWVVIDPEVLKRVLDKIVLESGVELWLHSLVTEVECNDGRVERIVVCGKGGKTCVEADVFIDCTGDADLAALAGAGFEYGDNEGRVQGMTLCFRLAGVDGQRFLNYKKEVNEDGNLHVAVHRAKENGDFPSGEANVATFALQNLDMAGVNFGHSFEKSPLDTTHLTQAEVESRKRLSELVQFFRNYVPGMEHCYIAASGPAIGVRETRRIEGEYRLTREDYMQRRQFEDAVVRYAYPIDVHACRGTVKGKDDQDDYIMTAYAPGESYTIPYRALLPKALSNVIVAGRALSSDRAANGSARVAPACFAMGQAAGTAAAICVLEKREVKKIDIQNLRALLEAQGVCL